MKYPIKIIKFLSRSFCICMQFLQARQCTRGSRCDVDYLNFITRLFDDIVYSHFSFHACFCCCKFHINYIICHIVVRHFRATLSNIDDGHVVELHVHCLFWQFCVLWLFPNRAAVEIRDISTWLWIKLFNNIARFYLLWAVESKNEEKCWRIATERWLSMILAWQQRDATSERNWK